MEDLKNKIDEKTQLVTVMHVNNETGNIQDLAAIGSIIADKARVIGRKIHFHSDAVQGLGKLDYKLNNTHVDTLSFSAHKIGALRGTGLLYQNSELPFLYIGGGQEFKRRPGTENLPGVWGMGLTLEKRENERANSFINAEKLASDLINAVRTIKNGVIHAHRLTHPQFYSPFILNMALMGFIYKNYFDLSKSYTL